MSKRILVTGRAEGLYEGLDKTIGYFRSILQTR